MFASLLITFAHLGIGSKPVIVAISDGQLLEGIDISDGNDHNAVLSPYSCRDELQRRVAGRIDVTCPITIDLSIDEDRVIVIAKLVACWETFQFHGVGLVHNGGCALQLPNIFV